MKHILTFLLVLLAAATAQAGVITAVVNNASWGTNGTWDLNRQPQNGDTVVIPASFTTLFNTDESLNGVIIKIYGTLNMNGGKKLNLNTASIIQVLAGGKVIGQGAADQIRIGNSHVFNGNDPDVIGPMYADNTTGSGFAPLSVMPVVFVNFYVIKENNDIKISWSTASEINNDHFEVEKSNDGMNFISIATVKAVGNSSSVSNYYFIDRKMNSAIAYYRIKQVDMNGNTTYTAISSIKNNQSATTEIFAANKNVTVRFNTPQSSASVNVYTVNGQLISHQYFNQANYISFSMKNTLTGVYVIQVTDQDKNTFCRKLFLN